MAKSTSPKVSGARSLYLGILIEQANICKV